MIYRPISHSKGVGASEQVRYSKMLKFILQFQKKNMGFDSIVNLECNICSSLSTLNINGWEIQHFCEIPFFQKEIMVLMKGH